MTKKNVILALAVVLIFFGIFKPKFDGWTPSDPALNTIEISVVDPPTDSDLKLRADSVVASLLSGSSDRTVDGKRLSALYHDLATLVELDGANQVVKTTEDIRQANVLSGNMLNLNIKDKYKDLGTNSNEVLVFCIGSDNVMLSPELRTKAVSAFKALSWACNEGSK